MRIRNDIYPQSVRNSNPDVNNNQLEALELFIYSTVLYMASFYKSFVQWAFESNDSQMQKLKNSTFSIIPTPSERKYKSTVKWAILIRHKSPVFESSEIIVNAISDLPCYEITPKISTLTNTVDFFIID